MACLRDWVISVAAPWMTSQNSSHGQIQALEWSMFSESFKCVLRACRGESAAWLLQRRDADLIKSDKHDEREDGSLFEQPPEFTVLL